MSVYDEVSRTSVKTVLEAKASNSQQCPICTSKIGTTISLEHDRACQQCGLKLWITDRDDEGDPEYRVDMNTTPEGRIRKQIRKAATMEAIKQELTEDE